MSEIVSLELPGESLRSAQEVASRTHRRVEDVLVEWIDKAAAEVPVESLSDESILSLCDMQMTDADQETLSRLLSRNRENRLSELERRQLGDLMTVYRRGLVRKAQAWKEAVARGLKASLS
ncbi:hypothetical protein [Candidatus Entotheonella palauensis]|uniref:Uncharacterized protein n=1 Tax=Candidatus Entotheonella gemina TaxID=1429439 RepID=W4M2C1_9BACT|nr:hypothetical protein [Candidatus Entotheonella palauensis]ETX04335.1 MAG: hypothetical protein ETSY2_29350 [Candidatus Entotheonella gemina]